MSKENNAFVENILVRVKRGITSKTSYKPECRKGIMLVPDFRKRLLSACVFVQCTPRLRHSAALLSIRNVCFHSEYFGTLFLGPSSFHIGISCSIKFTKFHLSINIVNTIKYIHNEQITFIFLF